MAFKKFVVIIAKCDICGRTIKEIEHKCTIREVADIIREMGWRCNECTHRCLCPECNKTYPRNRKI